MYNRYMQDVFEITDTYKQWVELPNRPRPYTRSEKKIQPNEPCSCGSGKKYKNVVN